MDIALKFWLILEKLFRLRKLEKELKEVSRNGDTKKQNK